MREHDAQRRWLSEGSLSRRNGDSIREVCGICDTDMFTDMEVVMPGFPALCPHHLPQNPSSQDQNQVQVLQSLPLACPPKPNTAMRTTSASSRFPCPRRGTRLPQRHRMAQCDLGDVPYAVLSIKPSLHMVGSLIKKVLSR